MCVCCMEDEICTLDWWASLKLTVGLWVALCVFHWSINSDMSQQSLNFRFIIYSPALPLYFPSAVFWCIVGRCPLSHLLPLFYAHPHMHIWPFIQTRKPAGLARMFSSHNHFTFLFPVSPCLYFYATSSFYLPQLLCQHSSISHQAHVTTDEF